MKNYLFIIFTTAVTTLCYGQSGVNQLTFNQQLYFAENKGQITDQNGGGRNDIQFVVKARGMNVFIGAGAIHYQFSKQAAGKGEANFLDKKKRLKMNQNAAYNMSRVDVILEGADASVKPEVSDENSYIERYYLEGKAQAVVRTFSRVVYREIYPGIDWVLYMKDNHLEYDFVVRPGGKVSDIRLRYEGAEALGLEAHSLVARTSLGTVTECGLKAYVRDNGKAVAARFKLGDHVLGFSTGSYRGTLVIDPTLNWGTYFGGTDQQATSLAYSDSGFVYMTGFTTSTTNIATTGAYQAFLSGQDDVFLSKFDSSGNLAWATYYGGTKSDEAYGVSYDGGANLYVTGLTTSTSGIATTAQHQTTYAGGVGDGFLVKFTTGGELVWGTYYGGEGSDIANSCAVDKSGNVYIVGYTYSLTGISTTGSYKPSGGDGTTAKGFMAKFTKDGLLSWATYYGGDDDCEPFAVATDDTGNVYMAGPTASTDSIATPGAFQTTFQGGADDDGFAVKFDSSGHLKWGTYLGAGGANELNYMTCDGAGNVYLTGSTYATDSIATPGSYQPTLVGVANAYLTKINSAGGIQWGTYFGSGGEGGRSVAIGPGGVLYIVGSTTSTAGIASAGAYQATYGGGTDAFIAKFSASGGMVWSSYYGGEALDRANSAVCDNVGNVYVAGLTKSLTGIASAQAFDTVCNASRLGYGAFLVRFGQPVARTAVASIAPTKLGLSLSPNPVTNSLTITWSSNRGGTKTIVITDMAGKEVKRILAPAGQASARITVTDWQAGTYTCSLMDDAGEQSALFTVTK